MQEFEQSEALSVKSVILSEVTRALAGDAIEGPRPGPHHPHRSDSFRHNLRCLHFVAVLLACFGEVMAQSPANDATATPAQASLRPAEPAIDALARVDKSTLALNLPDKSAAKKLLLYDFEFDGNTVPTDKLHLKQLSPGVYEITSIAYTVGEWRVRIRDSANYYGLGEHFDALNHAHTVVRSLIQQAPEGGTGSKGSATAKPVPFFMSTTGYGLWFDTTGSATFDMNAASMQDIIVDADAEKLRIVLFTGPEFPDILTHFTALARGASDTLPPYWAFAPWLARPHTTEDQLRADSDKARELNLPPSVVLASSAAAPESVKRLHEAGYKIVVPQTAFIDSKSGPDYTDAASSGFFVKSANGASYVTDSGSWVDFTNPRARAWWTDRLRAFMNSGADGFTETLPQPIFPADAKFADESDARMMRNRYAVLESGAVADLIQKDLKANGVLLEHAATTGSPALALFATEGIAPDFSPEDGLPTAITAALGAGLSGLPLWTSNLAVSSNAAAGDPNIFQRWTEFAAFTPVMQTSHMPWEFADKSALDTYRKFAALHMALFPYRYAAAQQAAKSGMPIMRALVLNYPGDEKARLARNEYLFGPDLLVAPIVDESSQRIVYLPPGEWLDYWTGKPQTGGHTVIAEAATDMIPLYVKQGSVLPKLPDDVMTLVPATESNNKALRTLDDRRVYEIFGASLSTRTTIIDFESRTLTRTGNTLTIAGDSAAHVILRWRFERLQSATVNGAPAKLQTDTLGPYVEFDHAKLSTIAWQ